MIIQCAVCGMGYDGPDIWFVKVDCTQEQYDNGEHYEAAEAFAEDAWGCEPKLVIDENDAGHAVMQLCANWDAVSTTPA